MSNYARRRRSNGAGALIFIVLVILTGAGITAFFAIRDRIPDAKTLLGNPSRPAKSDTIAVAAPSTKRNPSPVTSTDDGVIAKHPWWRKPMTAEKIAELTSAIAAIQKAGTTGDQGCLMLRSDGKTEQYGGVTERPDQPTAILANGDDNVAIVFLAGRRHPGEYLTRREARDLLTDALDRAYASEEKFRKTGVGNTTLDLLFDAKAPKVDPPAGTTQPRQPTGPLFPNLPGNK